MATLNGADLSHHNAKVDFNKLPGDFVILKATEGLTADDPTFASRIKQAKASGKLLGAYHYMHKNGGEKEAAHFLKVVGDYKDSITLWLDFEYGHDTAAEAVKFMNYVDKHAKGSVGVYLSRSDENTGKYNAFKGRPIWIAQYNNYNPVNGFQPRDLTGSVKYLGPMSMFQYTSTGRIAGVSGNTDLNVFYGDKAAWNKLASGSATATSTSSSKTTSASTSKVSYSTKGKTVYAIATDVINGKVGTGTARATALGKLAGAVQAAVNYRLGSIKKATFYKELAAQVKAGNLGSGDARKKVLGNYYDGTQDVINGSYSSAAKWVPQDKTYTLKTAVRLRKSASTKGGVIATLKAGDKVKTDAVIIQGGYRWARQPRGNGYGYFATGTDKDTLKYVK